MIRDFFNTNKRKWRGLAAASVLASSCLSAHAGMIELTTTVTGSGVRLTLTDDAPTDMCDPSDPTLCFADFTIDFDPTQLTFTGWSAGSTNYWVDANAESGGPLGEQVFVSFLADGAFDSLALFSLDFQGLVTGLVTVVAGPRDFGGFTTYSTNSTQATISLVSAVPEPPTGLLALLGLAGLGWFVRKRSAAPSDNTSA